MRFTVLTALVLCLPTLALAEETKSDTTAKDVLDEVNAARATRGLKPFILDEGLASAASACAKFRSERRIEGHTSNDFQYLPAGTTARAAGCAAWAVGTGWGSCCTYENYQYAGAAFVVGTDGRRYMHLFVR